MKNLSLVLARRSACDVLWFDALRNDAIESAVEGLSVVPLNTRTHLYLSWSIVWAVLWNFRRFGRRSYYHALVRFYRPKMVITGIHNSGIFWALAQENPDVPFLAVQNSRGVFSDRRACLPAVFQSSVYETPFITGFGCLACFGRYDAEQFRDAGMPEGQVVPVGSVKASFYKMRWADLSEGERFDICLVADKTIRSEYFVEILNGLAACKKISPSLVIAVAMKRSAGDLMYETDCGFIRQFLGEDAIFIPLDQNVYSSYSAADHSRVVVGSFSTLLIEMFSFGKKVLACNFTGYAEFSLGLPDECNCESVDDTEFSEKMFALLNSDQEEFFRRNNACMRDHNEYIETRPSHERLRSLIDSMLKA